jgi:biotin carboxyl carrier protein
MNEAFDQRSLVVFPEREGGGSLITQAHRRYAEESRSAELCSIPLVAGAKVVGVWLLERDEPFSVDELESLEALALALAPIVELKQAGAESLPAHAKRSVEHGLRRLTDTSHPGMKLIAGCVVLLLAILSFVEIDYRVSAIAVIEGAIQRAAVAPFDGYIQSAPAKAGDLVQAGQVLATLEDKDLLLERARWQAEHEVSQRKALEAMAKGDRVELRLASAQARPGTGATQPGARKAEPGKGCGPVRRRRSTRRPFAADRVAGGNSARCCSRYHPLLRGASS